MSNLAQSYGVRRPLEIAAKLAALRAPAPIAQTAPVLALVPAPSKTERAARIAAQQSERAEIRAYLPMMRAAAQGATYHGNGPTWEEITALESRLADLNDFLILENDPADMRAGAQQLPLAA